MLFRLFTRYIRCIRAWFPKGRLTLGPQDGFSMIETGLVLICIGIFLIPILRNRILLEKADVQTIVTQVRSYKIAVQNFVEHYNALPGNFAQACEYWNGEGICNGSGDGIVKGNPFVADSEAAQFWIHLAQTKLITRPTKRIANNVFCHSTALGGVFTITHALDHHPGLWLVLGSVHNERGDGALLTTAQVRDLVRYFEENGQAETDILVTDGSDVQAGDCMQGGVLNSKSTQKSCVVYFFLSP